MAQSAPTEQEPRLTFQYQPSQKKLFHYVSRGGGMYLEMIAPQCLEVGGQRSGKTNGKMVYGIENYCLKFRHCDMLVLRRTISELKSGAIEDFFRFFPKDSGWYTYNHTERIATFKNGSRLVFGGCVRKGTLIDTDAGLFPIEDIKVGDSVLTRKGYRRVHWSGQTGVKPTICIENTWLTQDHSIYCNGEFVPAWEILCRKVLGKTVRLLTRRSSYLKASRIAAGRNQKRVGTAITSLVGKVSEECRSTWPYMKLRMGQFLSDTKFIIKTAIPSITTLITSDVLVGAHIGNITNQGSFHWSPANAKYAGTITSLNIPISARPALSLAGEFTCLESCQISARESEPVPVYDLTVEDEHEYFANGLLVHNCENNLEKDIEKYLGQAYPFILVDECGQFSDYAWNLLSIRNLVNVQCEPDEHGNFPTPAIVGCTNPTGPFWPYYQTKFVKKEPWDRQEGMRQSKDGRYFVERAGEWVCVYDPKEYAYNHSTVLDNAEYLKRDPGIIKRLKSAPEALQKKFLYGYMDTVEGPYFDCFNEEYHVIDLRTDPDAIKWQDWQPVWVGHDWGVGHWSAAYFFTKALVKVAAPGGDDWKLKTVCFQEVAPESTGHDNVEMADMLDAKAYYPRLPESAHDYSRISGKRCKVSAIYFSHEKFSRSMEKHSPSDEYSRLMRARGLPPVSRCTTDRIGSAGFMYNELKLGRLVILKTCPGIIMAIPSLQRNKDMLDDVLKVDNKADDRYDAFRYGLYGGLGTKKTPQSEKDKAYAETLSPMAKYFYLRKQSFVHKNEGKPFKQEDQPVWISKI